MQKTCVMTVVTVLLAFICVPSFAETQNVKFQNVVFVHGAAPRVKSTVRNMSPNYAIEVRIQGDFSEANGLSTSTSSLNFILQPNEVRNVEQLLLDDPKFKKLRLQIIHISSYIMTLDERMFTSAQFGRLAPLTNAASVRKPAGTTPSVPKTTLPGEKIRIDPKVLPQ